MHYLGEVLLGSWTLLSWLALLPCSFVHCLALGSKIVVCPLFTVLGSIVLAMLGKAQWFEVREVFLVHVLAIGGICGVTRRQRKGDSRTRS